MTDVFKREKRSWIMSRILSRGNKRTELALLRILRAYDLGGWRRHPQVFGTPDFIFPKHRVAIFVDGCFWHSCPEHVSQPATNRLLWRKKLDRNMERDRLVTRTLKNRGWRVLRIWQHELKRGTETHCVNRIKRALAGLRH